ncbi:MAG TPA: hypothetical protein VGC34_13950, partial [Steroidobacteraceae bacterium]
MANTNLTFTPRPAKAQPSTSAAPARREWHRPAGIHGLLGDVAWRRLPPAVRTRFGEPVLKV